MIGCTGPVPGAICHVLSQPQYELCSATRAGWRAEHEASRLKAQRDVAGESGPAASGVHDPRSQERARPAQGGQVSLPDRQKEPRLRRVPAHQGEHDTRGRASRRGGTPVAIHPGEPTRPMARRQKTV